MILNVKYDLGQTVFLRTDPDQLERIITGIQLRPNGFSYYITYCTTESVHYEFELSPNRDIVKLTNN